VRIPGLHRYTLRSVTFLHRTTEASNHAYSPAAVLGIVGPRAYWSCCAWSDHALADVSILEVSDDLRVARWEVSYEWEHYTRSNQSYRFAILRVAYDCAEQRYASLSEELYADRSSSTPLRSAISDMAHLSWSEAKPGSIEDRQLRAVCETHSTTARAA
jgi:hypothetical protein